DVFLGKWSPSGDEIFLLSFDNPDNQVVNSMTTIGDDTFVGGQYLGNVSFGDVTLPAPDDAKLLSSFVVGFDSSGKAFWSVRGDTSGMYNQVAQVAVARDGNLLVTGSLSGNLDLGNKTLSSQVFDKSLLVAKLDPRKNAAVFAKNFGTCVTGHAIT